MIGIHGGGHRLKFKNTLTVSNNNHHYVINHNEDDNNYGNVSDINNNDYDND